MTIQEIIGPPTGSMADWMSALLVPGAKLLATTTYGPAFPLMLKPLPAAELSWSSACLRSAGPPSPRSIWAVLWLLFRDCGSLGLPRPADDAERGAD